MPDPTPTPTPTPPPSPPNTIDHLAGEALELDSPDAREAYLDVACGGDSRLRLAVEHRLADLKVERQPDPEAETMPSLPPAVNPASLGLLKGDRVGRYRLIGILGQGGFGVVWRAEQTEPVRREVALKVIKPGMDSQQVIARFEAERQALAVMDHPCVAKVFDAGVTPPELGSRPYFVMEHVPGVPITGHCDRHRLSINERLDLFMLVCEAVQHAHQKGIIHRDIKPSNILVSVRDGKAVPKVIDFGVAKALHQKLTEQTLFTEQGQMIGTPEYMSPEQAEMTAQDIDTRSDIYSLGVLLYELLTGALPFDPKSLREAAFAEIQRIIREQEPPKPSTRLSSFGEKSSASASARRVDPRSLERELRGDLDWIVLKALEKDRTRRYDTATGLAEDIRRHLHHEPVLAGPPSAAYRISRFVRRNRAGVIAVGAVLFVLLAGIAGTSWGLIQATTARTKEQHRADELQQVVEFQASQLGAIDAELMGVRLREDLITEARSALEHEGLAAHEIATQLEPMELLLSRVNFTDVALQTLEQNIFDRALEAVDMQFGAQPVIRARLLQTLALTLGEVGLLDRAMLPQADALEIRRRELGDDDPYTLNSINNMGAFLARLGRFDEAEPYYREALDGRRRVLGDDDPSTIGSIQNMGTLLGSQGRLAEAEPFYREALERNRRVRGDDDPHTFLSLNNLAFLALEQGRPEEAELYARQALEGRRRVLGEDHPLTLDSMNNVGVLLASQGKSAEAEVFYREVLAHRRRMLGNSHPDTLHSLHNLGSLLADQGLLAQAEPYYREALEGSRRVLGDNHPDTLVSLHDFAVLHYDTGSFVEAEALALECERRYRDRYGIRNDQRLNVVNLLADIYEAWHESEPDKGYDTKAAAWRAKLPAEEPTEEPSDG